VKRSTKTAKARVCRHHPHLHPKERARVAKEREKEEIRLLAKERVAKERDKEEIRLLAKERVEKERHKEEIRLLAKERVEKEREREKDILIIIVMMNPKILEMVTNLGFPRSSQTMYATR
jgi:hypothetical protein